ncbi:GntR family transcriptional regulator [Streptomyces sp. B-S-A8]|uniref:GntR family transcriptional regulator n=1 Tax=Streptomyces solicavernae TaxID=3043614 RepID=A0ABT6RYW9_9ACTN|nr:GntR family transcriptional regulator [Streptomyces sp. B-S-A8]MDI3389608.1 GntR family transcriptional regulator [Streptomyces sp. B-S-A8]
MGASGSASPAPYLRVAQLLRDRVADGVWAVGDRLPSRATLGTEFGVGDNVVRRAQEALIEEGLLEGRAGSGTFVRAPRERRVLRRTSTDMATPAPAGFTGTWESRSTAKVPAGQETAARLGIGQGDLCVVTTYEFFTEAQPVLLAVSWEPMAVTGGSPVVLPEGGPLRGRGVVARMRHLGIAVTRVVEVPHPVRLDRDQAQLLGLATGAQATLIERTHYAEDGRAVETADWVVPGDLWEINYAFAPTSPGA